MSVAFAAVTTARRVVFVLLAAATVAVAAPPATAPADASPQQLRRQLGELVEQSGKHPERDYTPDTWNAMWFARLEARRLAEQGDAPAADLDAARAKLADTLASLQRRPAVTNDAPRIALAATPFATAERGTINSVNLQWTTSDPADRFELQRATRDAGPFETIYSGAGASFADQSLADGTWFYRLLAHRDGQTLTSAVARFSPAPLPSGLDHYSNQRDNDGFLPREPLKAGDTYYDFNVVRDGPALQHVLMRTSKDGKTWSDPVPVLDRDDHPDLADFKFESGRRWYDPVNDQIVWWCHWERSGPHYGDGKAFVATAKPGQRFTVHHNYTPMGVQVRDMTVFVDDDNTGYLVAASNLPGQGANATLYIFKLNDTYTDVVEIVSKVAEDGYREAPNIVKVDGFYYLFFSQAAGWYPSRGGYASARSLAGPWSELRSVGNPSTFSSQSGAPHAFGPAEHRARYLVGHRWIRGEGTTRTVAMPLQLVDGFAFYDFAPTLLHDAERGLLVPLQHGQLLSQGRTVESSIPGKSGHEPARAVDGSYDTAFQSDDRTWPFSLTIDLGEASDVRNVQTSWYLHKGSEAFYTYTIEASRDGQTWATVVDRTNREQDLVSKTYGFTSDVLPRPARARYVRLNVQRAHLHNNPNNWYPPTIYEVKVFGDRR